MDPKKKKAFGLSPKHQISNSNEGILRGIVYLVLHGNSLDIP